ncbi:MAG: SUMF1/EgtB/PvdO family nonheme iron enzyme [Planctomycetota bacterium]
MNHPNIVQAIAAGKAGVYYYFAMEYVNGPTADQVVETEGPLPERRALEIIRDTARGLAHAHEHDIVHRDVKPDNILIAPDGTAKLADLGLAREAHNLDSRVTQSGVAVGTPNYISPEQAKAASELDGRTDLYSLAATLFHLVTGRPPYRGESSVETMYMHLHEPPPDPRAVRPEVSAGTAAIIRKAMAKARADRYQSAEEMVEDLEKLLRATKSGGTPPAVGDLVTGPFPARRTVETPLPGEHRPRRKAKNRTGLIVGGAVAAAGALAVIAAAILSPAGPERTEPEQEIAEQKQSDEPSGQTGRELLDYVVKENARHPDDYRAGLARWDRAIEALADDPVSRARAEDARAALAERYRGAAETALASVAETAETLAEQGNYDGALAEYAKLRPQFAELLSEGVTAGRDRIRADAESHVRAAMAEAQRLAEDGRPDQGLQKLKAIESVRCAPLDPERARVRAELVRKAAEVKADAQKRALAEARNAIDALLDRMEAAAAEGKLAEAATLARRAEGDGTYAAASDRLDAVLGVARALDRAAAVRNTPPADVFKPHLGKSMTLRTRAGREIEGELKEARPEALVIDKKYYVMKQEKHREYRVEYADLAEETLARFKPAWEPETTAGQIAAAILALAVKDADRVERALGAAKDHPLAPRYTDRLTALKMKDTRYKARAREDAARKAWTELIGPYTTKRTLTRADAERLIELLDAYAANHGGTPFAASKAKDIARLRDATARFSPETAWALIQRLTDKDPFSETEAKSAWDALDSFEERHGLTDFACERREEIDALRKTLDPHLPKLRFDSKLALEVWRAVGRTRHRHRFGATPTADDKGLEIPDNPVWWVAPVEPAKFNDRHLEILAAEAKEKSIPGFRLAGTKVTDRGLLHVRDLGRLRRLNVSNCQITDAGLAGLRRLQNLRHVCLYGCTQVTDRGLAHLKGLTRLQTIVLGSYAGRTVGITDAGLGHLSGLTRIEVLRILNATVTDRGLRHLAGMKRLVTLELSGCRGVRGVGFRRLSELAHLRSLSLGWTPVSDFGLTHIAKLKALEALSLPRTAVTDTGIASLGKLPRLKSLDLRSTSVTDRVLKTLRDMPALRGVNLGGTKVSERGRKEMAALLAERREADKAKAEADKEAEREWAKFKAVLDQASFTRPQAKTITRGLDEFEQKHGATRFAASVRGDISALRAKVGAAGRAGRKTFSLELGPGVRMQFVRVPAGSFLMGADEGDADEKPAHKVTITRPFHIGRYEVTQEQWEAVMGDNPSRSRRAKNPVENVSWDDCQRFLKKLNAKLRGATCSLPTEAEWEYACRAGSKGAYCFGDDKTAVGDYAWHNGNADENARAVGQKKPNAWGLYDMHGNVWEWCHDWYRPGYYEKSPEADPRGPPEGGSHVMRGGSWKSDPADCRSAERHRRSPTHAADNLGLRVALRGDFEAEARGRAEDEARAAWQKIRDYAAARRVTRASAKPLSDALDRFDEKYGGTRFAGSVAGKVATLRDRARPLLPVIRFESKLPLTVTVVEGAGPAGRLVRRGLGKTPTDGEGIEIPVGALWYVRPANIEGFSDAHLKRLVAECREKRIPGLCLQSDPYRKKFSTFTDAGLEALTRCPHLRYLDLRASRKISDAGMASVGRLAKLRYLGLKDCGQIGDEGLRHLAGLTELRRLRLSYNKRLTAEGLEALAEFQELRTLDVRFVKGVDDKTVELLSRLPHLQLLSLHGTRVTSGCVDSLARMRSLRCLGLTGADMKGEALAPLASLPGLVSLSLSTQVGDETLPVLARFKSLKRLSLAGAQITDAGLAHLKKLDRLEYLCLNQCKKITDGCVQHLRDMLSLNHVELWTTQISKEARAGLRKARPGLKVVP